MITITNIKDIGNQSFFNNHWYLREVNEWPTSYEFIFASPTNKKLLRFYLERQSTKGNYALLSENFFTLRSFTIDELKTMDSLKNELTLLLAVSHIT